MCSIPTQLNNDHYPKQVLETARYYPENQHSLGSGTTCFTFVRSHQDDSSKYFATAVQG